MKIITIIGARPQFIKAAMVSRAISQSGIKENIIHTGQHFDKNMSEIFFEEMGIKKPSINLGIGGGTHGKNTGRMIEAIEKVLLDQKADCVLVYGDTDSTLAGSLAASKLHIPVAHVESGLRSFNRKMPEEINRVLTDHISNILFIPTKNAELNLKSEGIKEESIYFVGDVMYDAALYFGEVAKKESSILDRLDVNANEYSLVSIHRAENTDDFKRLHSIISGLKHYNKTIIFPMHPRTKKYLKKFKLKVPTNVIEIPPVGFLDMIMLEMNANLIATDSGGVQKEAFFHKIPCVTLREETEWVELIDSGWNKLAPPTDSKKITKILNNSLGNIGKNITPYGNGNASELIANALKKIL
jgi:UDP-GlcNAc3NAcA epimerase